MAVTDLDKHCAAELKLLRKKHHIKQHVMFDCLGLTSQQQYSDLENGKKHFTNELVTKICSIFHISILQFISNEASPSNMSLILNSEDYSLIENAADNEAKLIIYKKLFLESKIEIIEGKLKALNMHTDPKTLSPSKHKIHVMI